METIALGPHQTLTIVSSSPEALEIDARWDPGAHPPPAHLHPRQEEHFEVLEGELTVTLDGETRVLRAGDSLDVPSGAAHAMWNASEAPARATWRVTPALNTHEMFRTIGSGGAADFLERFAGEFRLAT
ncbi:MAG: cupin domain-containing protein [Solirubrobacteraceae bacterium]